MLYLVSYDLRVGATADDYQRMENALTRLGGSRILWSQFVLRSNATARDLAISIRRSMDANDRLLVSEITDNWASYETMIDLNTV